MSTYASSEASASTYTRITMDSMIRSRSVSTAATEGDELDVMARSSPPVSTSTRVLRPRISSGSATANTRKRSRKVFANVEDSVRKDQDAKRLKMEDKKALTLNVNIKRAQLETARRRWLQQHRHLFEPLLPPSSSVFTKEFDLIKDNRTCVARRAVDEQPKLIQGGTMKDYQLEGLAYLIWMYNNGMNCILGDEMGLGKTLQTLSLFAFIKETAKDIHDPHLIICPLSVLSSWMAEAARWVPSLQAIRFHGPATERSRLKDTIRLDQATFDILVTTYEAYIADETWFKSRRWTYCVLDEGHKIKNSGTNIAHKVQGIGSLFRLVLTGTPVQNNLVELWGLLHWLYPNVFRQTSEELFKDSFNLERGTYSLPFLTATQNLLSTVMLRRTKANVELDVPPKEILAVFLPLTELQRFWTYKLLTRLDTMDLNQIFTADFNPENEVAIQGRREVLSHLENQMQKVHAGGQGNQWKRLMNLLIQLRRVCDHPYLLPEVEPSPFVIGEHIVAGSSKLVAIDKLLADLLPKGERILIFSQWMGMLDLLEDFMALRSIPYARLDGSTSRPRRALDIKLFQQEKSPYQVYLISTKAGGLGINLTKATTVIMCDSDWNPQNDLQAIARAHRIGQTKVVKVYQLICRGSVEDQMLDRIRRKLFLSIKVMSSDASATSKSSNLGSNELIDILRKGSSALSNTDDGMSLEKFLDADIEEILNESRSRENVREAKMKHELGDKESDDRPDDLLLKDAEEEEARLLSGIAQVKCRLFEGKMVNRAKDNKGIKAIAQEWQALQDRTRVDRIVMVDGMPFVTAHMGPATVHAPTEDLSPPRKQKQKFDSEEWCIYCRDGGELVLCAQCPRVFHAECHGIAPKPSRLVVCSQHACASCGRSTTNAGGMLFRCQTCPCAYCEDCMPEGEIDAIGDILPEFTLLGFHAKASAYYIRCHECHERFAREPKLWEEWQQEMWETQMKLRSSER